MKGSGSTFRTYKNVIHLTGLLTLLKLDHMNTIKMTPIGQIHSSRAEAVDDKWDAESSYVNLIKMSSARRRSLV